MSIQLLTLLRTAELPRLTDLDQNLLRIYADAHQDNLGKAILPMRDLVRQTQRHEKSIIRSRGRLLQIGALIQVTKGYDGQASEFAVSENFLRSYQVTDRLPVSRNKRKTGYQEVTPEIPRGNATDTDKLPDGYPKLKDDKTQIRKERSYVISDQQQPKSALREINFERWNVVTREISRDAIALITPGVNYERLLDKCEAKGWSLGDLRTRLRLINFSTAGECGAILDHVLRELAGDPATRKRDDKPAWCRREGCDPKTRQWLEPSPRSDGTLTNNCPYCHPLERRKPHNDEVPREMNDFLNDFGKMP